MNKPLVGLVVLVLLQCLGLCQQEPTVLFELSKEFNGTAIASPFAVLEANGRLSHVGPLGCDSKYENVGLRTRLEADVKSKLSIYYEGQVIGTANRLILPRNSERLTYRVADALFERASVLLASNSNGLAVQPKPAFHVTAKEKSELLQRFTEDIRRKNLTRASTPYSVVKLRLSPTSPDFLVLIATVHDTRDNSYKTLFVIGAEEHNQIRIEFIDQFLGYPQDRVDLLDIDADGFAEIVVPSHLIIFKRRGKTWFKAFEQPLVTCE